MKKRKPSYLTFRLDKELYAVSTLKLLEVLEDVYITPIPHSFNYLHGVIPFRGNIIPIINLHKKMQVERLPSKKNVIVVFEVTLNKEKQLVAGLVDEVREVLNVDDESIQAILQNAINIDNTYFKGMISYKNDHILVLDTENVFAIQEDNENN